MTDIQTYRHTDKVIHRGALLLKITIFPVIPSRETVRNSRMPPEYTVYTGFSGIHFGIPLETLNLAVDASSNRINQ